MAHAHRLTARLLGGFDVRYDGEAVAGFESQKVRALFAYLLVNHGQLASRDHLAALLWPERDDEAARRNLRQALYNIRMTFPSGPAVPEVLTSDHQSIRVNPELDCWIDVEAFQAALSDGLSDRGADPHQLAAAARLYSGDFLAGFLVKGSTAFEDWLVSEQERLREMAVGALQTLVDRYLARGEYRVGIQHALRLVAIDPLSEEAHRDLMRLYALSGRRTRALAQYEELRSLLASELEVVPLEETTGLYQEILRDELPRRHEADDRPLPPVIPLLGRRVAYAALKRCWERVQDGVSCSTLVTGEAGIGKTRLVASFLDAAAAQGGARVLRARCFDDAPLASFQMFTEALGPVVAEETGRLDVLLAELAVPLRGVVAGIVGAPLSAGRPRARDERPGLGRAAIFAAVRQVIVGLTRVSGEPLILFIDDLHWADPPSLELLDTLTREPQGVPLWVLATAERPAAGGGALASMLERAARADHLGLLELEHLDAGAVTELAADLVGERAARKLADFLYPASGGLPLAVAMLVNLLWDEGVLKPQGPGDWHLGAALDDLPAPPQGLDMLVQRRIRSLPASVRRLAILAAVAGPRFDAALLARAGDEHAGVVETALELMLERWLIRQALTSWASPRRERDLVLWASGVRRGAFEFAHPTVRTAILKALDPERRRSVHRHVAAAFEELYAQDRERACEALAYHLHAAGEDARALPYQVKAAQRAWRLFADENAAHYREEAARVRE